MTEQPTTAADALTAALYDDQCIAPPLTDHVQHVITALLRQGYRTARQQDGPAVAPYTRPEYEPPARQQDSSTLRPLIRGLEAIHETSTDSTSRQLAESLVEFLAALPPSAPPTLDVERLAGTFLRKCGWFPWGGDAWIHRDDEGTVMSRDDAIAAEYSRLQEPDRFEKGTGGAE